MLVATGEELKMRTELQQARAPSLQTKYSLVRGLSGQRIQDFLQVSAAQEQTFLSDSQQETAFLETQLQQPEFQMDKTSQEATSILEMKKTSGG